MPQRSLPDMIEALDVANSNLSNHEDDFPTDSRSLARFENALTVLEELAKETEDNAASRCDECDENPCVCEPEENEDDE